MKKYSAEKWQEERPWLDSNEIEQGTDFERFKNIPNGLKMNVDKWRRDGYVILENVISVVDIENYLDDLEILKQHPDQYSIMADIGGRRTPVSELSERELSLPRLKLSGIETISLAARKLQIKVAESCRFALGTSSRAGWTQRRRRRRQRRN